MLDFTSALYLGLRHSSDSLGPWHALTLGRPAALQAAPGSQQLALALAQLQGCEAATITSSTLHLFWDLFQILNRQRLMILVDSASYPVARWGIDRLAAQGTRVQMFAAHSVTQVMALARWAKRSGLCPVVVTDGYSPALGRSAPLLAYANIARATGGYLVLDDTQALGILGADPDVNNPWGFGGGGSLRRHHLVGPHIIVGASLAKAFGAPLAVLAGSQALIARYEAESLTRVHNSPATAPVILAAQRALEINVRSGDYLRSCLIARIRQLRNGLKPLGLRLSHSEFPVQTIASNADCDCEILQDFLLRHDVNTLLQPASNGGALLSFILNADHGAAHIRRALNVVNQGLNTQRRTTKLFINTKQKFSFY